MTGITFSVPQVVAFLGMIALIGPGFYFVGRMAMRVDSHEKRLDGVEEDLKDIGEYVRNGHGHK